MKHRALYFECFAGLSGDMCLAALINIGVPEDYLRAELAKLGLDDEYQLRVMQSQKLGIHGMRVDVDIRETISGEQPHDHAHTHDHGQSRQRDYKQIKQIIEGSALSLPVKSRAIAIFGEVARAEAMIHNMEVDAVHFHEVGATDSIVDIVGAAIGIEYLIEAEGIDQIICSPLELGRGKVKCAHGVYPVPAPATAQILLGVPVSKGGVEGEATTPTGAAILKACVDEFKSSMEGVIVSSVYGIGHRDADIPNVVRLQIVELEMQPAGLKAARFEYAKIEANIDDMSPEAFEPLLERLFTDGASDAFLQPIIMKKSRPAQMLSVLCRTERAEALGEIILNNSSTIGLRILPFRKMMLARDIVRVPTSVGDVSVKIVTQPNGERRFKSEHDNIVALARETGRSYLSLKRLIDAEISHFLEDAERESLS